MKRIISVGIILGSMLLVAIVLTSTRSFDKKATYKVIKVNGKILFVKTGTDMKRGDVYLNGTPLDFVSQASRAAVMSNSVRFVLQANSKGKVKVLPATSNVTPRAGALINLFDLQNQFSGKYLILAEEELQIGQEAFPMDDEHFFFIRYTHNGEDISKRLKFEGNKLFVNKDDLFKIDGKSIPVEEKEMTLLYHDKEEKSSYVINKFTPVFPDMDELKKEVTDLLEALGDAGEEKKMEEVISYMNDFYGKPQKDNLLKWLESEFDFNHTKEINFK